MMFGHVDQETGQIPGRHEPRPEGTVVEAEHAAMSEHHPEQSTQVRIVEADRVVLRVGVDVRQPGEDGQKLEMTRDAAANGSRPEQRVTIPADVFGDLYHHAARVLFEIEIKGLPIREDFFGV